MEEAKKGLYYGWWIVGACLLGTSVVGGTGFYCFGVFFPRIMAEFHWSRAAAAGAISVYWIASGLAAPFIGRSLDRLGPKPVMVAGILASGFSLVMLSFTRSLFYFHSFYALLAVSHSATAIVPYGFLISNWFRRKRGKAMGITTTGISLGGLILVPVTELLIHHYGWRTSYIILGISVALVATPVFLLVIKTNPREAGWLPDGVPAAEGGSFAADLKGTEPADRVLSDPPWPLGKILQTLPFWLMSVTVLCTYMVMFGVLTHQIPFIMDMGITSSTAAAALSFTALMGIIGKLSIGFMADRFSVKLATVFTLGLQMMAVLMLTNADTMIMIWIYVFCFGFAMGGATLRPLLPTWLFGLASLGTLQGITQMFTSAGSAVGPYLAGYMYDVFQSYHRAFVIFAVICGIGLVAITLARPARHKSS